jgi:hypothetical protein
LSLQLVRSSGNTTLTITTIDLAPSVRATQQTASGSASNFKYVILEVDDNAGTAVSVTWIALVTSGAPTAFASGGTYATGVLVSNGGQTYYVQTGGTDSNSAGPSGLGSSATSTPYTQTVGGLTYYAIATCGTIAANGSAPIVGNVPSISFAPGYTMWTGTGHNGTGASTAALVINVNGTG